MNIIWTNNAINRIEGIAEYIREDNPTASKRILIKGMIKKINKNETGINSTKPALIRFLAISTEISPNQRSLRNSEILIPWIEFYFLFFSITGIDMNINPNKTKKYSNSGIPTRVSVKPRTIICSHSSVH